MSRLFETVYLLLERKSMTARELAEHFEVSVRTVYRDIDTLCQAGIPIYASKGRGGGIHLMENFVLNKSMLSDREKSEILWALQGIQAVRGFENGQTLSKLQMLFGKNDREWIEVDFTNWGNWKQEEFHLIKEAIVTCHVMELEYFNSSGQKSARQVEPLQLWFKGRSWYLKAFCRHAQDYRLFKLVRIRNLKLLEETFNRSLPEWEKQEELYSFGSAKNYKNQIKLWVHQSQAYRLYDDYDESCMEILEDGNFLVSFQNADDEWVIGYILSYGFFAKVLEPESLKKKVKERLEEARRMYE